MQTDKLLYLAGLALAKRHATAAPLDATINIIHLLKATPVPHVQSHPVAVAGHGAIFAPPQTLHLMHHAVAVQPAYKDVLYRDIITNTPITVALLN